MARVNVVRPFTPVIGQVRAGARVPSSPATRSGWWARSVVPAVSPAIARRLTTVARPLSSPSPSCARPHDRTASGTRRTGTDRGTATPGTDSTAVRRRGARDRRVSAGGLGNPSHRCRRTR